MLSVEPPQPPYFNASIPAWVLTRYSDVDAALRDPRLKAGADGPWHERYREAAVAAFSGPQLARWRAAIQNEANILCRCLATRQSFDVVNDFARPLSATAAGLVTGHSGPEAQRHARAVFDAAAEPFDTSLQEHGNDATRRLAEIFGGELAPLNVQAFVALSESLPAFLGNSYYALWTHSQRASTGVAIEELLRYAGPSKAQLRRAAVPVEIDGAKIDKDDRVILMLASANRDPSVFNNPGHLDITRSPNKHLAFGAGPHSCLGGALVRMASDVALNVLFELLPSIKRMAAKPRQAFALRAIESLEASTSTPLHPDPH